MVLVRRILIVALVVSGGVYLILIGPQRRWSAVRWTGIAIAAPSLALWALARIQLGDSFAVQARARKLVVHGLYSRIRNPIYVFGLLFLAGIALSLEKPAWLLFLVPLAVLQNVRARREARVLEAAFGDEYRSWRKRTWF